MASDALRAALDTVVNAVQAAVLLAARIEADQMALRAALDRAAAALTTLKPQEGR